MTRSRPHPALAASQRRAGWLGTLLVGAGVGTAWWFASSPQALPAFIAPVMSTLDRLMAALVALGLGVYAFAFAREAWLAAQARRWGACAWAIVALLVQGLLAILALSFAFPPP